MSQTHQIPENLKTPSSHDEAGAGPSTEAIAGQDTKPNITDIPERIGPYRILRLVGRGGMGSVYEATHERLDRRFALKALPRTAIYDPDSRIRFEREAKAVGKLDHPNVVRATDAGDFEGLPYLAMELVEGSDLSMIVKTLGPIPINEAVEIIRQTASGLAHAHQRGVIHRDIKPSNIMLTMEGQVKILDLGLALCIEAVSGRSDSSITGNTYLGTQDYMAPEQWNDPSAVDAKADIYGLGCVFYFILTGAAPFAEYRSSHQKMKAHSEMTPRLLTDAHGVPIGLARVVSSMLAKNQVERPTATELIQQLRAFDGPRQMGHILERTRLLSSNQFRDGDPTNVQPPSVRASIIHASHDPSDTKLPSRSSDSRIIPIILWILAMLMLSVSLLVGVIVFFQLKPVQ